MRDPSLESAVLAVLEETDPRGALSVQDIIATVTKPRAERDRSPGPNEIRGRLTHLYNQGVIMKPERGRYAPVRFNPPETKWVTRIADSLSNRIRREELRRTVIWDATPYLERSEDGGPGVRLVVEHAQAPVLRDEAMAAWPPNEPILTWTAKTQGPLGSLLWEPDEPPPNQIHTGILFAQRAKLGVTGLTARGYRAPFPERVMMEFLGFEGPSAATPVVQDILEGPDTDFRRLWQAAESLGRATDLATLLAGRLARLPPGLESEFLSRMPPVVRNLIEGIE